MVDRIGQCFIQRLRPASFPLLEVNNKELTTQVQRKNHKASLFFKTVLRVVDNHKTGKSRTSFHQFLRPSNLFNLLSEVKL